MKTSDTRALQHRGQFTAGGAGISPIFGCAMCSKPSRALGSGVRMVMGSRQKVCGGCKSAIDKRRAAAAA